MKMMFLLIKLFCLLSSVWHVISLAVPLISPSPPPLPLHSDYDNSNNNDDHVYETVVDVTIADQQPNLDDYCWSDQLDSCSIIGNFTRTTIGMSFPVHIDCMVRTAAANYHHNGNDPQRLSPPPPPPHSDQYFYRHFQHVEVIALNGCGMNVASQPRENLLGIQYIPDPLSVRHLTLEMFKTRGDLNRGAFAQFKNIKTLLLINNKIESLNAGSFDGLSRVKELIIQENSIESIESAAFNPCSESLERLVIHESHLKLGELEPLQKLFEFYVSTNVLNWTALTIGIESLNHAAVSHVEEIVYDKASEPRTFKNLTKLEVTYCKLKEFPIDRYPRLQLFNVSHNELTNISMKEMQMLGLHTLDIGYNSFLTIDGILLSSFWDLEYFHAAHNQIVAVNPKAFQKNYNLKLVDLQSNRLRRLPIDPAIFLSARFIQIEIDHNRFDCAWINDYYGMDPHIFTTKFAYTKDYSDAQIHGLRCIYYSSDFRYHTHLYDDDDHFHSGVKSRRQPHPVEILRRNPKHTAFLTICILIVGVSCLLISLFFYVKYRTLTTTLNSYSIWDQKFNNINNNNINSNISSNSHKDKGYGGGGGGGGDSPNRPDIIQDRVVAMRQIEMSSRSMLPKSASSPRSIEQQAIAAAAAAAGGVDGDDDLVGIEFKDFVGKISEQRKASLPNRFECLPIGTHRVIFAIEPDTLLN